MAADAQVADYVIVGAGSAGCVLANRLSADPRNNVILIEAGGKDRSPWIHIPAGFFFTSFDEKLNWNYQTEPCESAAGRTLAWRRGKGLGGSSLINGMMYIRGQREDFEHWRQLGNTGWGFDDVLPYFRKSEGNVRGADALHGGDGPLKVSDTIFTHEMDRAFIDACTSLGFPHNPDFNGLSQEGAGQYQFTIGGRWRSSTSAAYLRPALKRPNLQVISGAAVTRLLFEGKRAIGVEFRRSGRTEIVRAAAEVLLSAGAIASPQVLQLSGVGPGAVVQSLGVDLVCDAAAVGENMVDHLGLRLVSRCEADVQTANELSRSLWLKGRAVLDFCVRGRGWLMSGPTGSGLFARTQPGSASPDVQYMFMPGSTPMTTTARAVDYPACTLLAIPCRPESRGWIRATSPDAAVPPAIQPNYLEAAADQRVAVSAIELARQIFATPQMKPYAREEEVPGRAVRSQDELLAYARGNCISTHHATGTCAMGPQPSAVVDTDLKVRGVEGLRVVDASVMPSIMSGNTNATVIMIAEKISDTILAGARA